jgi:hypothetical protein
VHSIVFNQEEARDSLAMEALMHEKGGWEVTWGDDVVVARQIIRDKMVERVITIRESSPLDDVVS